MKTFRFAGQVGILLALLGVAGCASTPPASQTASADSGESLNRDFHKFNVGLDTVAIRPLAVTYDEVSPTLVKHLVANEFSYLSLPVDFANFVLQGEVHPALVTLGRFTLNTVIGAVGLLDPATEFGLKKQDTDFGVTLAKWGVGQGGYFVLPVFGPATPRDAVGRVVDIAFKPTTYLGLTLGESAGLYAGNAVDFRDRNMKAIDDVLYHSEDSYVSLKSIYLQRRQAKIAGGQAPASELPNIFDQKN